MALLTKKFQKLGIFLLSVITIFIFILSERAQTTVLENLPEGSPKTLNDIKYQVQYYQELMRNYTSSFSSDADNTSLPITEKLKELLTPPLNSKLSKEKILQENTKFIEAILSKPITEPKLKLSKISDLKEPELYQLENATFVSLVRNSEVIKIRDTVEQIEWTFNDKYHYPYVFLNDKPFSEKFKKLIQKATKSKCYFEQVDARDWDKPDFIDPGQEEEGMRYLEEKGVGYARKASYHNMCRYYSKGFYNHPRMKEFKYYWRIELSTSYFCDIEYDVFKFMRENDKVYGYVLNLYDSPDSVRTLWPTTVEFLSQNPQYLHENSATTWLRENLQNPDNYKIANGYSTCHFWSNFEIGDMDFYRGEAYTKWVEYLDQKGGFYYERWGDAPVHSIGLGLFADKSKIHWFRDIGYEHMPYYNCPVNSKCNNRCQKGKFSRFKNLNNQNCQASWVKYEMNDGEINHY